uniref:Uncharacterized protein n=1 Tax=Panagrolaimus davidi TaxID=227884 RepID=A0A914PC42_9BILA
MLSFNTDGMVRQWFAFKDPIMDYILKNLKPEHLIKLYQCCKYFYAKFRRNIIRHLEIVPDGIAALPELFHCCIKKLESLNGIDWSGYKKLTKARTIEELNIAECLYFPVEYGYVMYAPVESIIAEVPNAKSIEISNAHFTEETCEALLSVNRNVKFSKFILRNITLRLFDFPLFKEFILKNAAPECHVRIDFELFDEDVYGNVNKYLLTLATRFTEHIKLALETKKIFERML